LKLYNIAFGNLGRRKAKVFFLITGLLIGIATIVALLSITKSMTMSIEERLDRFGANIVMIPRSDNLALTYGGITVGGVSYEVRDFAETDIAKIRNIEAKQNLGAVAPKVIGVAGIDGKQVLLMGVDLETELGLKNWWHLNGDVPDNKSLIAGNDAAKSLGLEVGSVVRLQEEDFLISAVLGPTGGNEDGILIGDLHTVQGLLGKVGRISMVEIAAFCRDCPISDMVLQIADIFPEAKVTALKQAVMAKMQSIEFFKTFSYGVAALVTFIGSLLVFVTMMGAVNERTREIGIFRAIGFRQSHIMQIVLLEAIIVGFFGGVIGYLFGNGVAALLLPLVLPEGAFGGFDYNVGFIVILLAVALSLMASFYPARKGSRLDPSEALRTL